jgi:hypothetical protein
MRKILIAGAGITLAVATLALTAMMAQAQRYRVTCVAQGVPGCATSCGSNTHTVVCYAQVRNGRCFKYCGRPR